MMQQPEMVSAGPETSEKSPFVTLERLLDDLAALLSELPVKAYVAEPVPGRSGSIGGHVRHVLDHIAALAAAEPSATLCYDRRQRGTAVETDPSEALRLILRLKASLAGRSADLLEQSVQVVAMIDTSGESVTGWSTIARELAYVVSHTIHHEAIIALLLSIQGIGVPEWFGYAPSTPRIHGS